jgi:hypothetical protein
MIPTKESQRFRQVGTPFLPTLKNCVELLLLLNGYERALREMAGNIVRFQEDSRVRLVISPPSAERTKQEKTDCVPAWTSAAPSADRRALCSDGQCRTKPTALSPAVYTIATPYGIEALAMAQEKFPGAVFREFVPGNSG